MTIGNHGRNLIFILSQPRSGSTLLQRILAAHPRVKTASETWLMLHLVYALKNEGIQAEYDHSLANTALKAYLEGIPSGDQIYLDGIRTLAVSLYNATLAGTGADRFVDKTPRYYYIGDDLINLFPEAKFIILFRNPAAVLASILDTHVQGYWLLLSRYKDDLLLAPQRLIELKQHPQSQAVFLNYETLVTNPENTISGLCDFLGIPFLPSMIDYGESSVPPGPFGDKTEVNRAKRPHPDRMEAWKELARDEQTSHFAGAYLSELGNDTITEMGYDPQAIHQVFAGKNPSNNANILAWDRIFYPDPQQQMRRKYAELAILEHRRLVFRLRKVIQRLTNP